MTTAIQTVRDFCIAWSRLDLDELMRYFLDDAVYQNMPGPAARGESAIRKTIAAFLSGWDATEWEIANIAAEGHVVFVERIDRTTAGGKHVALPVVGVFRIEDGKIAEWRDYFDLSTYTRAMS